MTTRLVRTAIAAVALCAMAGCTRGASGPGADGDGAPPLEEVRTGPHGGRLLVDGRLGLEVTIFERGVPPELRVYPYEDATPIAPDEVDLTVELRRFGGRVETFGFGPRGSYLVGDRPVEEPHSFDVTVAATYRGATARWEYASYEGRTELSPAAAAAAGIGLATVGPATIRTRVAAYGRVVPNEDRLAHVVPRYPGIAVDVRARLGERVARGDVLARVESNQTLRTYDVVSPLDGTVIAKHVVPGELAGEGEAMYAVADLSTVWVDLNVAPADFRALGLGRVARVTDTAHLAVAEGRIIHLSPLGAASTQTLLARVELDNADGTWRPGLFVTAEVMVDEREVPVAVRASALQTIRDRDVVFLNDGSVFQAMPVQPGRRDDAWVEIVAGLAGGERYVAANSFVVKADVGKSGAAHDDH